MTIIGMDFGLQLKHPMPLFFLFLQLLFCQSFLSRISTFHTQKEREREGQRQHSTFKLFLTVSSMWADLLFHCLLSHRPQFVGMLQDVNHNLIDPRGRLLPRAYDVLGVPFYLVVRIIRQFSGLTGS